MRHIMTKKYPDSKYITYEDWQDFNDDWRYWQGRSLEQVDDITNVIYLDNGFIIEKI